MDKQLNEAIRSALSGVDYDQKALELAMSEELGNSSTPAAIDAAVVRRLQAIRDIRSLLKDETTTRGDDVKPLALLDLNDATVWRMLRLAQHITAQLRVAREGNSHEAIVVGIVGCAGSGKSTFVQMLKLMLRSEYCTGETAAPPRCEEVSIDDFLTSQKERAVMDIPNRWELNSTAEYFAESVLAKLKTMGAEDTVNIP